MRYFLFSCVILFSCAGSEKPPKDVLPPDKMKGVFYDVVRSDEMVDFLQLSDSTYRRFPKRTALYDSIFQLHATTKQAFQKSLKYYQGRPDLLKEILEDMQKRVVADTVKSKKPSKIM